VNTALADAIDALLPQTQCRQCGHTGCKPYAEAIALGSTPINRCPPGGSELIAEIATLLNINAMPLNPAYGATMPPAVAIIDEAACIGCALCIDACPVDAIVGARKLMHTVIAAECTGCSLCLPPCPVDCITVKPTGAQHDRALQKDAAGRLKERYLAHRQRGSVRSKKRHNKNAVAVPDATARKRAIINRVLTRAQARLAENND
jgi:electron transport complex protein RnfB